MTDCNGACDECEFVTPNQCRKCQHWRDGYLLVDALNTDAIKARYVNRQGWAAIHAYIKREYLRQYQVGILEVC